LTFLDHVFYKKNTQTLLTPYEATFTIFGRPGRVNKTGWFSQFLAKPVQWQQTAGFQGKKQH
jgi:hypothetical protein